jgi:hypothetical protein
MRFYAERAGKRGILLIEAMVYIASLGVVLIIAAAVFDKGMRESAGLQRNITDIERALNAGERWRADVRAATGPIRAENQSITIPNREGAIVYAMEANKVRRTSSSRTEVFLAEVKDSRMIEDRRGKAVGWRWEVELEHRRKEARLRPLFTFMAVAGKER